MPAGCLLRILTALVTVVPILAFLGLVRSWNQRPAPIEPPGSVIATVERADVYVLLARGFLKGQLSLDAEPDPALGSARNPYEPAGRGAVSYPHDASFYQGRFYSYFGPAPALLTQVPWRLLTGRDLPTSWSVFVFVSFAWLGLVVLYRQIAREVYPDAAPSARLAGLVALGSTSLLLPLAGRPAMYEAAIAGGAALMVWGLCAAWRAHAGHQAWWGAISGILFGLAIAARPTFGLAALPAWMFLAREPGRSGFRLRWNRGVAAALAGGGALVALVLAYNHARFGSPLEFGQRYQLSSVNEGAVQHFSARFLPTQVWLYFLSPVAVEAFFPFLKVPPLASPPPGFGTHEFSFGLLANLPFLWLAAWLYAGAWRRTGSNPAAAPLLAGLAVSSLPLLLYYFSCIRYQTEFALWLALAAALGALEFGRTRLRRVLAHVLAWAAMAVVALVTVQAYAPADAPYPATMEAFVRWLNAPARSRAEGTGLAPGPVVFDLRSPGPSLQIEGHLLVAEGPGGEEESVTLVPVPEGNGRILVRRTGRHPGQIEVELPPAEAGSRHQLRVSLGSLYPLNATELDGEFDRDAFRRLRNWLRIDWDGKPLVETAVPPVAWRTRRIVTGAAGLEALGRREYPGVLAIRREPPRDHAAAAEPWGGARVRWTTDATQRGRSFPLGASGSRGAANFLFVRPTGDGQAVFGYDHWGKPGILSPPQPLPEGTEHTLEFWMPSLVSGETATPLVVRLNGRTVWTASVPFFPAGPGERFLARNPIGGSSCEPLLPGSRLTAKGLPHPTAPLP